jgi:putative redox protein
MDAKVTWKRGLSFTGAAETSGFTLPLGSKADAGEDGGFRPTELLLLGLAGCTGMDVISILEKKRQQVTGLEVRVHGDRAEEHPKVFTRITVEYVVSGNDVDPAAVTRAVELSEDKYCACMAMLRKAVEIETKITITP